jgi:bifunctional non-homologous end joining protein LigD
MPEKLREYRGKRDFSATKEPAGKRGKAKSPKAPPRFVIQEHSATRLHWDLRLEHDGALASWAIPNFLPETPKDNRLAVRTEDHPLEYLEFHGDIPAGSYGAGTMTIWDSGTYELLKWTDDKVEVDLHGERISGRYALFSLKKGDGKDWMIHRMDPPADPAAEPMPERVLPMLAKSGKLPPDPENWGFEVKWDGVRAICFSEPGRIRFVTRNLNDVTDRYPELHRLNRAMSHHRLILDGEIVALDDEGRPSFAALQRRMHLTQESRIRRLAKERPVRYMPFDLLWIDGHSLMDHPYVSRREALLAIEGLTIPEHVVGEGEALLAATAEQRLEGVIAKRLDSTYEPGKRSACWVKIKHVQSEELVIGGWEPGEGRRKARIGSLLVGIEDDEGKLRFAGEVGTGFTEAELDRLAAELEPLETKASPFSPDGPKPPRGAHFVEPRLRASVEFLEWTKDGVLRAPSYKGLVESRAPVEVVGGDSKAVILDVEGREVRLSNPDKVLWPAAGFTKRQLVDYFVAVAPVLLPHLECRQLTLKRYPNGVEGEFFYEKNAPAHRPQWVQTLDGFVNAADVPTLVWLANLADIELHTPMHRAPDLDTPTMVAFDLDPGKPATIIDCCRVALLLQGMFENLGLQCFPKTSGSKGMQVYLPLNVPGVTYDMTKSFAKAVAELLESAEPKLVVSTQVKARRKGKVLVDWSQNDRHKTTVCVYSPRARERPTCSTPLTWDEVGDAKKPADLEFETDDVLARVQEHGDLFAPVLTLAQELPGG